MVKQACSNFRVMTANIWVSKLLGVLQYFSLYMSRAMRKCVLCLMSYANNKGADQPVHPRSLISTFIVRCLDSLISLDSIAEISRLSSFCDCAGRFVSEHVLSCRG